MSEPFLGQVSIVGFSFAPRGWATCDGQILPINQNQSLYSLLGTTYGGDGRTTFALPDPRSRTPIQEGQGTNLTNRVLGSKGGEENHVLQTGEIPSHTHAAIASSASANRGGPDGNLLATTSAGVGAIYSGTGTNLTASLAPTAIANAGANQGHNDMQPYLTLNYIIALSGLFPSRN